VSIALLRRALEIGHFEGSGPSGRRAMLVWEVAADKRLPSWRRV
jgi:hypothetical protein